MKIIPKTNTSDIKRQLNSIYDDNFQDEYYDGEDLSLADMGFSVQSLYPKTYEAKIRKKERDNYRQEFNDSLYDEQIAYETNRSNKVREFTKRIPLSEYDKLTDEERLAYHQYLIDSANDED